MKCTAGCPVAPEMDIYPHQIIRLIVLGEYEKVLKSRSIWTCLQCLACSARCPNDIDVARIIETLRKISVEERLAAEHESWRFDKLFLESVARYGRVQEMATIMRYKIGLKKILEDSTMGLGMLLKGRIGIFPHTTGGKRQIRKILHKINSDKDKPGR